MVLLMASTDGGSEATGFTLLDMHQMGRAETTGMRLVGLCFLRGSCHCLPGPGAGFVRRGSTAVFMVDPPRRNGCGRR